MASKSWSIGRALLFAGLALAVGRGEAPAATTLLGPIPYLDATNSPLTVTAPDFVLEDFEDGLLDQLGVSATAGALLAPGANTDSADGDDGLVDGLGRDGHSFFASDGPLGITFQFDATALGGLPREVGIVWTDGEGEVTFEQALKRLAPGGRLVAIVGEGMGADKPAFREWWQGIQKVYNVRANIGIDGKGYAKYGTTFDNQILVIDKTGPTKGTVLTGKVADVADLPAMLEGVRNDRPNAASEATQPDRAGEPRPDQRPGGETPAGGVDGARDDARPGADALAGRGEGPRGRLPAGGGKRAGDAGQAGDAASL